MAYVAAGGDTLDYVADPANGLRLSGVEITVLNGDTDEVVTDLLDASGDPCTVWTSDSNGQFAGSVPDTLNSYKVQVTDSLGTSTYGPRVPSGLATSMVTRIGALESSMDALVPIGPTGAVPRRGQTTPVTTFQAGHGWSVTGTGATSNLNDSSDFALGTQSLSATSSGAGDNTNITIAGAASVDLTGQQIRLLLKVDNLDALDEMYLWAGDTGYTNYYVIPIYSSGVSKTLLEGEWQWLEMNMTAAVVGAGSPDWSAVTTWLLRFADDTTSTVTVHINAIGHAPDQTTYPNGVLSIAFDDSYASQYSIAAPIMDAHGFPGCAFTLVDALSSSASYMTLAQLRELREWHGWEIAGHSYASASHNTRWTNLDPSDLADELRSLKMWLVSNGFGGDADYVAYPGGEFDLDTERAVARYFSAARTIAASPYQPLPAVNPHRLRAKTVANTTATALLTGMIDTAYAGGSWLILVFHNIAAVASEATDYATADFTTVVDYAATVGIPVRTIGEVLQSI
jgi:peptidoglycan/xylan/chitin deacetylase (PgdA/CDA1 family)